MLVTAFVALTTAARASALAATEAWAKTKMAAQSVNNKHRANKVVDWYVSLPSLKDLLKILENTRRGRRYS